MWSANDPAVEVVETSEREATLRVPLHTVSVDDEGYPIGVEDYSRFKNWAVIIVPTDEVEGLCAYDSERCAEAA